MSSNDTISVRGLTITYPPRVLFEDFDVDIGVGMTALLGPSGSGKTTLLAVIAGFESPRHGEVHIPDRFRHPTGIGAGWIMQSANVIANRSALDNVQLPLLALGVGRLEARRRAKEAIESVGLGPLAGQVTGRLSGGERQRVAVARALAANAPLVLADEPTASLGQEHRRLVVEHLAAIAAHNRIVVIATHDLWVAERCHAVIDLRHG